MYKYPFICDENGVITSADGKYVGSVAPQYRYITGAMFATAPEMVEVLDFTLKLLGNLTSDEYSKGGDKPARDRMEQVLRKVRGE